MFSTSTEFSFGSIIAPSPQLASLKEEKNDTIPASLTRGALSHNGPVTEDEKHVASEWLKQMEEATASSLANQVAIDQEIERLMELKERLQERKSTLKEEDTHRNMAVEFCRKVHAPIRRVPFEVLSEIAQHCAPETTPALDRSMKGHLLFSHVCSSWRVAALSTPRLWSVLRVSVQHAGTIDDEIKLVAEWFKRAKGLPITLLLFLDESIYRVERPKQNKSDHRVQQWATPADKLLHSLAPISPRLRQLSVVNDATDIGPLFPFPANWDLSHLECLEMRSLWEDWDEETPITQYNFPLLPALTHLSIDGAPLSIPKIREIPPWAQLTSLKISPYLTIAQWIPVMIACISLQTGVFSLTGVNSATIPIASSYSGHSDLKNLSLTLDNSYDYSPVAILQAFHFEGLQNLDIGRLFWSNNGVAGLSVQLEYPLPNLKRLYIFGGGPALYLHDLLKMTPGLRELSLDKLMQDYFFVEKFTYDTSSRHNLVPQLTTTSEKKRTSGKPI